MRCTFIFCVIMHPFKVIITCIIVTNFENAPAQSVGAVKTDEVKENFKQLLNSTANKDTENRSLYRSILGRDVHAENEHFDTMKTAIQAGRIRNMSPVTNSHHNGSKWAQATDIDQTLWDAEEASVNLIVKKYDDFKKRAEELQEQLIICRYEKRVEIERQGSLKTEKKQSDRVVGAVVGRGAVESLFLTYVKPYLPTKQPGVPYTKLEMDKAYTDFFSDKENELAQALLKELPNWKNTDLAITVRKIYGKLSYVDHSLFNTLNKMHNYNQVIEYINSIGASLSDAELDVVKKIAMVLLEHDEFYTLPTTVSTAATTSASTPE